MGESGILKGTDVIITKENMSLSDKHLQDLLSDVISSFRAENTKLMESFRAENTKLAVGITANLTANFKEEIQQFYDRITMQFHTEKCRLKEELTSEFQSKVTNLSQAISNVRDETDRQLEKVTDEVQSISGSINERVNAYVVDTRKKTESIYHEVEARTKALIFEIQEHKTETDSSLKVIKQDVGKIRKEMSAVKERLHLMWGRK